MWGVHLGEDRPHRPRNDSKPFAYHDLQCILPTVPSIVPKRETPVADLPMTKIITTADKSPLYVPIPFAASTSGIDAETVRVLTLADPHPEVGDVAPIRSIVSGRTGVTLVDLVGLMLFADAMPADVPADSPF